MIRVAAVGDIHLGEDSRGTLRWCDIGQRADLLVVAGDLTRHGTIDEARVVADELAGCSVPVVCVLGNHDYHHDQHGEIATTLRDAGVVVLDGSTHMLDIRGQRVGIAGVKGFGGGFAGKCATAFGEPEMKSFVGATLSAAERLRAGLHELRAAHRIALLHYAPIPDTLRGEPPEIYPFLGSYLLGAAIDDAGADLAVHGHAHSGCEAGRTPGGVPVRNVAQPVIQAPYAVYRLEHAAVNSPAPSFNEAADPAQLPASPAR